MDTTSKKFNILIVDDAPQNIRVVANILKQDGYQMAFARDGKTALAHIKNMDFDLILLDIMMPDMDGFEVCRRLKANETTRDIPIIFLTVASTTEDKIKGLELGGVDYITKPFQADEVLARVNIHLSLQKMRQRLEAQNRQLQQEIAERKRTEEALRESEQKFRSITNDVLDGSQVGIFILDADFQIVWINQAIEHYFGIQREHAIGHDKRRMIRETIMSIFEEPQTFMETVFATYDNNTYVEKFDCHVLPDGKRKERWLEHKSQPILTGLYAGGRIEHYYDITERKQAENALRERENDYRTLVDNLPGVAYRFVVTTQGEYRFDYIEEKCSDLFGIEAHEILADAQKVFNLIPQPDADNVNQAIQHSARSFTPYKVEHRVIKPNGDVTWIYAASKPQQLPNGDIAWDGIGLDITERKRAEEKLQQILQEQSIILDNVPVGVAFLKERQFIWMNQKLVDIFGYTMDDMKGSTTERYYPSHEEYLRLGAEAYPILSLGETYQDEWQMKRRDGSLFWCLISGKPVNPARLEEGSIWLLEDITERKRAEEAIEEANDRLKARVDELSLLNTIAQAVAMAIDLPSVLKNVAGTMTRLFNAKETVIGLLNAARTELTISAHEVRDGIQKESLEGVTFPVKNDSAVMQVIWEKESLSIPRAQTDPRTKTVHEILKIRGIQSLMHIRLQVRGDIIGIISISSGQMGHDFTSAEVKLAETIAGQIAGAIANARLFEEAQHAREEAEAANQAKSEFLANMSHEIRTPMNAILGFTDVLASQVTDEQQKSYLDAVQSSSRSLLTLINDILDLSKIDAGKLELHYEPVDLATMFREINHIFSLQLSQKQLDFTIDISEDIPKGILLDEVRLRQILFNLVGNAVKFTEQGYITLSAYPSSSPSPDPSHQGSGTQSPLSLREGPGEGDVFDLTITIKDSGIGIPPEAQAHIFDVFRQQDHRSTRKYGGTGLGLAITKRLVEMMHGSIALSSEPGQGSLFTITFRDVPITRTIRPPEREQQVEDEDIIFEPATILIVDDIASNRHLVGAYFREMETIHLLEAENGEEALFFAEQFNPDIILMDIRMPVMDGREATKQIKQHEKLKHIPVIALTAFAMKQDQEKIMDGNGFDGYLVKPVQRADLFHELARFLRYSRQEPGPPPSQQEIDEETEPLSPETLEKLPEIIERLEHEMTPLWEAVRQHEVFDEIEDFACQIKEFGERYSLNILEKFGSELLIHVRNFDIDQIEANLAAYPHLVERLRLQLEK